MFGQSTPFWQISHKENERGLKQSAHCRLDGACRNLLLESATKGQVPGLGPVEHRHGAFILEPAGRPALPTLQHGVGVHREGQDVLAFCVPLRSGVAGTVLNLASLTHLKSVKAAHSLHDEAPPAPERRPPLQTQPRATAPAAPSAHPEFLALKNNLQDALRWARAHQALLWSFTFLCRVSLF